MNRIINTTVSFFCAVVLLCSCDRIVPVSLNVDPNNPTSVTLPSLLLTPVQVNTGYSIGGDGSRFAGIFSQYYAGLDRQFQTINDNYQLSEADIDQYWTNIYTSSLNELQIMQQLGATRNGGNYVGAAQVLRALNLANLTDVFGDIPSTNALGGASNLRPTYDTQQQVYTQIQSLLDSALVNLAAPTPLTMGADDQIYRGNLAQWRRAASALKARYSLRLTKLNANTAATNALTALRANPMVSNADDFQLAFPASGPNPMNQFQNQRGGNIDTNRSMMALMRRLNDPRITRYTLTTGNPNSFHVQTTSPVIFISFAESKLTEAEALLRTGQSAQADSAYRVGVRASFTKVGLTEAQANTYLAQDAVSIATAATADALVRIQTQKYLAVFPSGEGYHEWRRTGVPALTPNPGQNAIPRRFPYPQAERFYNDQNRTAAMTRQGLRDIGDLATPVWWDGGR